MIRPHKFNRPRAKSRAARRAALLRNLKACRPGPVKDGEARPLPDLLGPGGGAKASGLSPILAEGDPKSIGAD